MAQVIVGTQTVAVPRTEQSAQAKEIERLRSTCELYDKYKPEWDFYLAAYTGGKAFANKENLHKHPREHPDDFEERCRRIHYLNYCEPLTDFFTDFIFADTIQRDGGANADFYNKFLTDVNKKGDNITAFMKESSQDKDIFGLVHVLVDAPPLPEDRPLTKAEEQRLGLRPYWVLIRPNEILDWVTDEFDKYRYVKRRQMLELWDGSKHQIERYYEWTPNEVKITDIDVTDTGKPKLSPPRTLPNALGEVPIVTLRYRKSKIDPAMADSFLLDIAYNNKEVMNLTSLLQEFLYRQCFNILAMQVTDGLPVKDQEDGDVGTANVITYPKGATAPSYIAPSAEPADKLQEEMRRIIGEMYRRAAQDTINELYNGGKASGFSKAQSFSTTVPKIATRADVLEKGEMELMRLTMRYMGKEWDGKVKYKDHYEITNVTDALTQLSMMFRDLGVRSETLVKEELKRMVHEIDGKLPVEKQAKVDREIDAMNMDKWFQVQEQALIGKPQSPADQQKGKSSGTMAEIAAEAGKNQVVKATKKLNGRGKP